jgi:hypothetical protein
MNNRLPETLRKYFWDCDFDDLSMEKHPVFITERVLNFGDMVSVKWLLANTERDFLKKIVENSRNLDKKTRNYWNIMLRDDEPEWQDRMKQLMDDIREHHPLAGKDKGSIMECLRKTREGAWDDLYNR